MHASPFFFPLSWRFWIIHTLSWATLVIAFSHHRQVDSVEVFLNFYGSDLLRFVLSTAVLLLFRFCFYRNQWQELNILELSCLVLGFNFVTAGLISVVVPSAVSPDNPWFEHLQRESIGLSREFDEALVSFTYSFFLQNLWCFFYTLIAQEKIKNKAASERQFLDEQLLQSKSLLLQKQLNPHFLFNGLNNICSLIDEDPTKAQRVLRDIAQLMRFNINAEAKTEITVEEELDFLHRYLSVCELQYEQRLRFSQKVDPDCLQYALPPLAIQTLVENAIKHGLQQVARRCDIQMSIKNAGVFVNIEVCNDGRLVPNEDGQGGVGLENLRQRLRIFFGEAASLAISQAEAQVIATLRIPKKRLGALPRLKNKESV